MKLLLRSLLVALAFPFAATLRAEISAEGWLETYYLNPKPDELPQAIRQLRRDGYFDGPGHIAVSIGFISTVFAQNADRVDGWLLQLHGLDSKANRLIASALWQAGHPLGSELLRRLGQSSGLRTEIEKIANTPVLPVEETAIRSVSSLNLHWGAFLASGSDRYILSILDAVGLDEPALTSTALATLARHAAEHPRVLEICQAQLDRQPEDVRGVLRAVVNSAAPAKPAS